MSHRRWLSEGWGQGVVIAATLLMLAVALCLFDTNRDGVDDPGSDLCNVLLAVAITVVCLGRPLLTGWSRGDRAPSFLVVTLTLLDPPPRFISLS